MVPSMSASLLPPARRVFCNRTLNLWGIRAIGYDMDYTLIHYRVPEWEGRAFAHAVAELAEQGWPVRELVFDPDDVIQGLVVDREQGNLLKVDRFGFVKSASHGLKSLSFQDQRRLYSRTIVDHRDPRFVFTATLFSLSELSLFGQLVELFDAGELPEIQDYTALHLRVRQAVDDVHRKGALKGEIVADPERFVEPDPETVPALLDQLEAGKRLLLITNSDWDYTRQMMAHVFNPHLPQGMDWRSLFALKIVSARKPDFFQSRSPLLEVVSEAGLLRPSEEAPTADGVYFGGNAGLVEEALGLSGDQILYVGDHFFGDVQASKGALRWRTALVVRELELEIEEADRHAGRSLELSAKMAKKEELEQQMCRLRVKLTRSKQGREPLARSQVRQSLAGLTALKEKLAALDASISPLATDANHLGNSTWGPLMRAGNDKSYLAFLVERFADIYTSRVSNLLAETPYRYFRSARGSLPHDRR